MIHPRTLKILVVVLLLHAGVLMLIQLGLIQSPLSKEEPPELQVNQRINGEAPEVLRTLWGL